MKKFIAYLSLALLCVSACLTLSCSDNPTEPSALLLVGDWNWVESCGGIAGTCNSPTTSGHSKSLKFTASQIYLEFEDGRVVYTGTYKLDLLERTVFDKSVNAVLMSGRPCEQLLLTLTTDELELVDNCIDGFTSRYKRLP